MKKISYLIVFNLMFILFSGNASAASINISAPGNVTSGTSYTVSYVYSGDVLGSIDFDATYVNASCSLASKAGSGSCNSTGSDTHCSLFSEAGFASGTTLLKLNCTSTVNATFKVNDIDAYDITGRDSVSVSRGSSQSVTVSAPTTTTTTTQAPTTTTTRAVVTTKAYVPQPTTTVKQTTAKQTTTAKSTTVKVNDATTTVAPTEAVTEVVTDPTTEVVESPKVEETTTTKKNEISDDVKLSSLKIVGYDIDFKPNQTNYSITVARNIDEVYVIAKPVVDTSKIDNVEIVNIKDKNNFVIKVTNEKGNSTLEYVITVNREEEVKDSISFDDLLLILIIVVFACIIEYILINFISKKKDYKKLEKITNVNVETVYSTPVADLVNEDMLEINDNPDEDLNLSVVSNEDINNISNKDSNLIINDENK